MRRWVIAICFWLWPFSAWAQLSQCLDFSQSWSTPYYQPPGPTIKSVAYLLNLQLLIGYYSAGPILILANVPQGVAQPFASMTNADARWNQIYRQYKRLLLNQNGCPLLAQSGNYLLANP